MRLNLSHPLWTHIPAIAALAVLVGALASAGPLPDNGPIHYGPSGQPDSFGSPWIVFAFIIVLSVGFIALSLWLDELWCRQEPRKSFNYFALLDEFTVSAMVAQGLGHLNLIQRAASTFSQPVEETLWVMVPAVGAAVMLEKLRPFTGREINLPTEDTSQLRRELARTLRSGAPFVYSDIQNPAYVTLLSIGLPVLLFVSTALQFALQPWWVNIVMATVAVLLASFYGGLRTVVTRDNITVRFGTPGYRALQLRTVDVAEAAIHHFMPLKEFGGYGIRANHSMKAYFLSGGTGVLVTTREGKKHLLGTNRPEQLAAVLVEVAGLPHAH
jgi:hypothetical protein